MIGVIDININGIKVKLVTFIVLLSIDMFWSSFISQSMSSSLSEKADGWNFIVVMAVGLAFRFFVRTFLGTPPVKPI